MNTMISIFLSILIYTGLFAQAPDILWTKIFGIDSVYDVGRSVKQTRDGGYIITGFTEINGTNDQDIWLIKTDSQGEILWSKTFGDSLDQSTGSEVLQTADEGYVVVGRKTNILSSRTNIWLVKTDSEGDTLWTKNFGDNQNSSKGYSIKQAKDSGYIITGNTGGDILLIKTDENGDSLWTKIFDGNGGIGHSVQQTSDDGYIMVGVANRTVPTDFNYINGDLVLIKTDSYGDTLWTKTYSDSFIKWGNSVQQTSDDGYIITGLKERSRSRSNYLTDTYLFLVRTDVYGDTLWTKAYRSGDGVHSHWDEGTSVLQTADNGFIIIGNNFWLIRTDSSGDTLWTKILSPNNPGNSISKTDDGGYIVTGTRDFNVLLIKISPDITDVGDNSNSVIENYWLSQNYPNPFNPSTTIEFTLPRSKFTTLKVYNILGAEVATLVSHKLQSGIHKYTFDGSKLASGIYYYEIRSGEFRDVKKMILLR